MSQVTLQGNASGTGIFTVAAPNSNTNRTLTLPDATGTVVTTDATQTLTNKSISGAQIDSGTVAVARLGSGSPSASNFLRGDGSWQAISVTPTTAQVLTAYAGASVDAVGTYAFMGSTVQTQFSAGDTTAGSNLRFAGMAGENANTATSIWLNNNQFSLSKHFTGGAGSGTWRCMGVCPFNTLSQCGDTFRRWGATLWLRIS